MHIVQQYNEGITVGMLAGLMNSRLSRLHPVSRCMHFTTTFSHCIWMLPDQFTVSGWIYSSALWTELKAQLCYHKILFVPFAFTPQMSRRNQRPFFSYQDVFHTSTIKKLSLKWHLDVVKWHLAIITIGAVKGTICRNWLFFFIYTWNK